MDFTIDKTCVREGEVVEVTWNCPNAESVKLTIDNGFRSASVEVERQGSKKYKLNRSKGKTVIVLVAVENGKPTAKSLKVKVQKPEYDAYTRLDNKPFAEWFSRLKSKFNLLKIRFQAGWKSFPPQKKQAYILLLIIFGVMILSSFFPKVIYYSLSFLAIYLIWTLLRR